MKRFSESGNSPLPKHTLSDLEPPDIVKNCPSQASNSSCDFSCFKFDASQTSSDYSFPLFKELPSSGASVGFPSGFMDLTNDDDEEVTATTFDTFRLSSLPENKFDQYMEEYTDDIGIEAAAKSILKNRKLYDQLSKQIFKDAHSDMKKALKKSILTSRKEKKKRDYLLQVTPERLCDELKSKVKRKSFKDKKNSGIFV